MSSEFFDKLAILDFNITQMTELIVRDFPGQTSLISQQSWILLSMKDLRDTLLKEPKKD